MLFYLPLYDLSNPNGSAVAFLTSLKYGADNYLSKAEVKALRAGRPDAGG